MMNDAEIDELYSRIKECDVTKPYAFISYSRWDKEVVYKDIIRLQELGVNLWMDKNLTNELGNDWTLALKKMKSSKCKMLIFYISENSITSPQVYKELKYALSDDVKRYNKEKCLPIIPIDLVKMDGDNIKNWVGEYICNKYDTVELEQDDIKRLSDEQEESVENRFDIAYSIVKYIFGNSNVQTRHHGYGEHDESYYNVLLENLKSKKYKNESDSVICLDVVHKENTPVVDLPEQGFEVVDNKQEIQHSNINEKKEEKAEISDKAEKAEKAEKVINAENIENADKKSPNIVEKKILNKVETTIAKQKIEKPVQNDNLQKKEQQPITEIGTDEKIGAYAKNLFLELFHENKISKQEVKEMLTQEYATSRFNLRYPLLARVRNENNRQRYWKDSVDIHGEDYYLCSQWFEPQREALMKWEVEHRQDEEQLPISSLDTEEKIGSEAKKLFTELFLNNKISKQEVKEMLTQEYATKNFKMGYPILTNSRNENNKKRYWKDAVDIYGQEYYLCSQWHEAQRVQLEKWSATKSSNIVQNEKASLNKAKIVPPMEQNNASDMKGDKDNKIKKEKEKFIPETVEPIVKTKSGDISIGEVRNRFSTDETFCMKIGDVRRTQLPFGGRSYMDYAMAAVLGGCNNVKESYQINYYTYAIADRSDKKDSEKIGATWTWSSNARKIIGWDGSGHMDKDINDYFENLSTETTLNQLITAFEKSERKEFITKKNSLAICGLLKVIEAWK